MDLSVIIVNWNSVGHLRKCLASIYGQPPSMEFEVIVVDNASYDGSAEMMAAEFPQGRFVQSAENAGFAAANNQGFAHAAGRALLFLNPDTEVHAGAIDTLYGCLELPGVGVVGAKLLNTDGSVQDSCIQRFPTILNQALDAEPLRRAFPEAAMWGMRPLFHKQSGPVEVEVISGACMMLLRETFEQVGRFTAEYFMYAEDLDLCYKCVQAGRTNYYEDRAVVVHHGGVSTGSAGQSNFSAVTMRKSLLRFFELHYGTLPALGYRASVVAVAAVRCALLAASGLFGSDPMRRNALSRWKALLEWGVGAPAGPKG